MIPPGMISPSSTTDETTEVKSKKVKSKKTKSKKAKSKKAKSKKATSKKTEAKKSKSAAETEAGVELPAPSYKVIWLPIGSIKVDVANRRPIIPGVVKDLVTAIPKDGLRTPLTVRLLNGVAHLITGFQRLEALKILKWDEVPCVKIRGDRPAQRWQIVENLQRGELPNSRGQPDQGIARARGRLRGNFWRKNREKEARPTGRWRRQGSSNA